MVGARTVAMVLNRLVDADRRAEPADGVARAPERCAHALAGARAAAASLGLFLVAVFQLDPVVRWLWPIPVAMFFVYPYSSSASRGLRTSGSAPVSGSPWSAPGLPSRERAPWEAWAIGGAVLLWVAGFDLFYSLFDVEHDRETGLHS